MNNAQFDRALERRNQDPVFNARLHGAGIAMLAMGIWRSRHDEDNKPLPYIDNSCRSALRVVMEELNNLTGDFCRSAVFYSTEAKARCAAANVTTLRDKKLAKDRGQLLVLNNGPTLPNSITTLGLCYEHSVPNGQLWLSIDDLLEGSTGYEDLLAKMKKYFQGCFTSVVTREENQKVIKAGLNGRMPPKHKMLVDHSAARYKVAGIFENLEYNEDYWGPLNATALRQASKT